MNFFLITFFTIFAISANAAIESEDLFESNNEMIKQLSYFKIRDRSFTMNPSLSYSGKRMYGYQWYELLGGLDNKQSVNNGLSTGAKLRLLSGTRLPRRSLKDKIDNLIHPWYGLCDGVANLSLVATLPSEDVEVLAPSGKLITLSPLDVHGLASFAMMNITISADTLGNKKGLNPGMFHLAVMHRKNIEEGIVVNISKNGVDNRPVYSINLDATFLESRENGNRVINIIGISGVLEFAKAAKKLSNSLHENNGQFKIISYELYVDSTTNQILGGQWTSKFKPRLLWKPVCKSIKGDLSFLNNVLKWNCNFEEY